MADEFLNKLDELSIELKKLSDRDKIDNRQMAKNALDNVDDIDRTIVVIDQLIKEKDMPNIKIFKTQIEIDALKCYKEKLLSARKEWISIAERNIQKNVVKNVKKNVTKII